MERYFLVNTMYSKNKEVHTSAEHESSILKSYKHVLKVPISPIPGSGSKTYLNGWNRDLSLKTRFCIMKNTNRYNNFERFFFICIQNIKKTLIVLYIFWKALLKPIWKCKIYMQRYNTFLKNRLITNPREPIFVLFCCLYKTRYNYLNIYISILKYL